MQGALGPAGCGWATARVAAGATPFSGALNEASRTGSSWVAGNRRLNRWMVSRTSTYETGWPYR